MKNLEELKKEFVPIDLGVKFQPIESAYAQQGGAGDQASIWYEGRAIIIGVQLDQSNLYPVYRLRWELTDEYKAHWADEVTGQYWGEDMACDWDKAEVICATGEYYDPKTGEIS